MRRPGALSSISLSISMTYSRRGVSLMEIRTGLSPISPWRFFLTPHPPHHNPPNTQQILILNLAQAFDDLEYESLSPEAWVAKGNDGVVPGLAFRTQGGEYGWSECRMSAYSDEEMLFTVTYCDTGQEDAVSRLNMLFFAEVNANPKLPLSLIQSSNYLDPDLNPDPDSGA